MIVRDFRVDDYEAVKALHEASGDDYILPALTFDGEKGKVRHPLFVAAKVLEVEGKVVLFMGARMQAEMYLISDRSKWNEPKVKMGCIKFLDQAVRQEAWLEGVDDAVCYVPPTKKRFVKRIYDWLGYRPPRIGWTPLSRPTKETN